MALLAQPNTQNCYPYLRGRLEEDSSGATVEWVNRSESNVWALAGLVQMNN